MTLYECLGIENNLTDKKIPLDEIVENISDEELQYEALCYFEDISGITQRAFFNRNGRCLEIFEVELNRADHIDKISELIQRAICCWVLIIFVYAGRYAISANGVKQSWIYEENLEDELVAEFNFSETGFSNEKINDIIGNAKILSQGVREIDYICLRQLCDWMKNCTAEYRVWVYDVLEKVREKQWYRIINDIIFIEKEAIYDVVAGLSCSYDVESSEDNTPVTHEEIEEYETYLMHGDWKIREKDIYYQGEINSEIPEEVTKNYILTKKMYGNWMWRTGVPNIRCICPTTDGVIWKSEAGKENQPELHWIGKQKLDYAIIFELQYNGVHLIESLQGRNLNDFCLSARQKVELIKVMDKYGVRPFGVTFAKYPDIMDYINKKYVKACKCVDCGKYLEGECLCWEEFLCSTCRDRRINIKKKKTFRISCSCKTLYVKKQILHMTWNVSTIFYVGWKNHNLTDVCIALKSGALYHCDFKQRIFIRLKKIIREVSITFDYLSCNHSGKKLNKNDIKFIHFVYKDVKSKVFYLYVFQVTKDCFGKEYAILNNYLDYLDYDVYYRGKTRRLEWQGPPSRQDVLYLYELPPVREKRYQRKSLPYKNND